MSESIFKTGINKMMGKTEDKKRQPRDEDYDDPAVYGTDEYVDEDDHKSDVALGEEIRDQVLDYSYDGTRLGRDISRAMAGKGVSDDLRMLVLAVASIDEAVANKIVKSQEVASTYKHLYFDPRDDTKAFETPDEVFHAYKNATAREGWFEFKGKKLVGIVTDDVKIKDLENSEAGQAKSKK